MDLSYGPQYEEFRREVRAFLKQHEKDAPSSSMRSVEGSPELRRWQALLIEKGYVCRTVPREYGGFGGEPDLLKTIIIEEEFQEARIALGMESQGISMFVPTLLTYGSEEQKRSYVGADDPRRDDLVPGLQRARRRQRSREPQDQRRARRRRVRRQRPEDLDQHRQGSADDVRAGAHRARRAEAPGHQLPAARHEDRPASTSGR